MQVYFYPKLKPISDKDKSTKQVVVEYLGSKYVQARESYDSRRFSSRYYFVLHSSVKEVFDEYYHAIQDIDKPGIAVLRKHGGKADIEIISKFLGKEDDSVNIRFRKKIYDEDKNLLSNSIWEAKMRYHLSDYDFTKSTNARINFIVTQYDLKKIK